MSNSTKKTIKLPSFSPKYGSAREVDYSEFLASFKRQADTIPDFVLSLKEADNAGWQRLIDDLANHIQSDAKLSKFIRERHDKGVSALSIGEPNWAVLAALGAFAVGYAIGTACYKLGPCNFVS